MLVRKLLYTLTALVLLSGAAWAQEAPVVSDIPDQTIAEGESFTAINLTDYVTDPDNDVATEIIWTYSGNTELLVDITANVATITVPSAQWNGSETITFTATDPGGLFDSDAATFTVTAVNDPPVVSDIPDQTIAEGGSFTAINLTDYVTDPDNDVATEIIWTYSGNTELLVDITANVATITVPDAQWNGSETITFTATDPGGLFDSDAATFTVTAVNDPPVVSDIPDQTVPELGTFEAIDLGLYVYDPDNSPAELVWTYSGNTELVVDITDGIATVTLPFAEWTGSETITFTATDPGGLFDSDDATFTVTSNNPPVLDPIGTKTVVELQTLAFTVTASDLDGTPPVLSTSTPLPGTATFTDNGDGSGLFDWTPSATDAGTYYVTFFATDAEYPTYVDSEEVMIIVGESGNQAPVFVPLADTSIAEGSTLIVNVSATDPDGGPPALSVNTSLANHTFVDNGDGTGVFTYSPDFTQAGVDTVRFFATDDGSPQTTTTELMVVTTIDVNQPPTIEPLGPFAVEVTDTLEFIVVATDSANPDPLARLFLSALNMPPGATFSDNGDNTGTFFWVPQPGDEGVDTVTFIAVDEGSPALTGSRKVEITVVETNFPPVLDPIGPQTVTEGETLIVNISASDPDGPMLQLLAERVPANAEFVDNGDGTGVFTFTPNFLQSGLYTVTFKAYDGIAIDKENVIIQVYDAGNQAPVFDTIPTGLSVVEGDTLEAAIYASDPELAAVTLALVDDGTVPPNLTFADSGNGAGGIFFTPDYTQSSETPYLIRIAVSDGDLTDTATVDITVIDAGPQDPVLDPIADQTVTESQLLEFTVTSSDPDGDPPVLSTSTPLPGAATFTDFGDGTGRFSWQTDFFDAGSYDIMFYAEDATRPGVFDSQLVNIIVIDSNQVPFLLVTTVNNTGFEGDTLIYGMQAWDNDLTIPILGARIESSDTLAPNMEVVDNGDGTGQLVFIPDHTQGNNNPTFYYVRMQAIDADDPTLITESGTRRFDVYNRNFPPTMSFSEGTGPFSLPEGDSLIFTVTATDIDATGLPTVVAENLPVNATFTGSQNIKTFRFYPDFTQAGDYTVRFIATDAQLARDTVEIDITVTDAGNVPPVFTLVPPDTVICGAGLVYETTVSADDPNGDSVIMTAEPILAGATVVDQGDGTLIHTYEPTSADVDNDYTVLFIATDVFGAADTVTTVYSVRALMRGDTDGNSKYTVNDIIVLANYLFRSGPAPVPLESGDVDMSGTISVNDIAYMVNFMYNQGPRPPQ